jgi:hypothetical protein
MKPSQAGVCLVGTTMAALLLGCTSSADGPGTTPSTVAVHVGLFGGPGGPGGGMAASDAPQADALVSVVSETGRTWRARTGRDGTASVSVPAGRYTVSTSCGSPQPVTVPSGHRASVEIQCAVP